MGITENVRAALHSARTAIDDLGIRLFQCTAVVAQYDRPLGVGAVFQSYVSSLTFDPRPRVRILGPSDPSWMGGGIIGDKGDLRGAELEVTGITIGSNPGVGYADYQVNPRATSTSQWAGWIVTGPGLQALGEPFLVHECRPLSNATWLIHLRRTVRI